MNSIRTTTTTRAVAVAGIVTIAVVLSGGVASAAAGDAATLILAKGTNPWDGITPDFSVFGVEFTKAWQKILGGAWGLVFVWLAFSALRAAGDGGPVGAGPRADAQPRADRARRARAPAP